VRAEGGLEGGSLVDRGQRSGRLAGMFSVPVKVPNCQECNQWLSPPGWSGK
jgi:hypothetical protein